MSSRASAKRALLPTARVPGTLRKNRWRRRVTPLVARPVSRSRGPRRGVATCRETSATCILPNWRPRVEARSREWKAGRSAPLGNPRGVGFDRGARRALAIEELASWCVANFLNALIGHLSRLRNSKIASQTKLFCRRSPQGCPQDLWISDRNTRDLVGNCRDFRAARARGVFLLALRSKRRAGA